MKHALAGLIGQRERQVITAVVDQVKATNENKAKELMPIVDVPASILIHQTVSSYGGKTGERTLDGQGKAINGRSRKTKFFEPGSYQEFIRFNERDLLKYAKLGTLSERGVTGLNNGQLSEMEMAAQKLKGRIENRMSQLIWDSFFTGKYAYQAVDFDFGVPVANSLTSATDWTNHATSKPFDDLFALVTYNPYLIKYKIKEIVINPKTMSDIMLSQQTRDFLKNYNLRSADINEVAQLAVPGLPPIKICKDAYQDESYDAEGNVTLGNAAFFVPDNKVLLIPDFGAQIFQSFGQFQIAENMNAPEASIEKPAQGIYIFVDEEGLRQKKNVYVDIVAGFNGAPNLMRNEDVFVVDSTGP
jgi:hypothetical protein